MTGIETILLRELCDISMRSYSETEQNADEQDAIIDKIFKLRETLSPEQKQLLNLLLDNINNDDSRYSYEAFKRGFLFGMVFGKRENPMAQT